MISMSERLIKHACLALAQPMSDCSLAKMFLFGQAKTKVFQMPFFGKTHVKALRMLAFCCMMVVARPK